MCIGTHDVSSSPLNCLTENTRTVLIITTQTQLDNIIRQSISSPINLSKNHCFYLILSEGNFILDLPLLMKINLGANGSLAVMADGKVTINCTTNVTDPEMLRRTVQPISHALLISFDGFVFTECPVPILIEDVTTVMILNCVFM